MLLDDYGERAVTFLWQEKAFGSHQLTCSDTSLATDWLFISE